MTCSSSSSTLGSRSAFWRRRCFPCASWCSGSPPSAPAAAPSRPRSGSSRSAVAYCCLPIRCTAATRCSSRGRGSACLSICAIFISCCANASRRPHSVFPCDSLEVRSLRFEEPRDVFRVENAFGRLVPRKDIHEPLRLLGGLSDARIHRHCRRGLFQARGFDRVLEDRHGLVTEARLVRGQSSIKNLPVPANPHGKRVGHQLCAQERVADAHPGKRIAVVGGVTDKSPACAEAAAVKIRQL